MKKICIVGAGAIGTLIGARLAAAGVAEVSALARGATLAALQTHGWHLETAKGLVSAPVHASDDPQKIGVQDLVIVAVKGPALGEVAKSISQLISPQTVVLPAMNGVPWWFCSTGHGVQIGTLRSVDPEGAVRQSIPLNQVMGCVVHASAAIVSPGHVAHRMGGTILVGEPIGGPSTRADAIADLLGAAGFDATASTDIRSQIWYKLWGNLTMNPVSAITGATLDDVLADPLVRDYCSAAMAEVALIGERIGCTITQSAEDRHVVTAKLGKIKTSMLQDVEASRPIELDALVTVVHEIGRHLGCSTPNIDGLLGLTRLFGRVRGLYPKPSA